MTKTYIYFDGAHMTENQIMDMAIELAFRLGRANTQPGKMMVSEKGMRALEVLGSRQRVYNAVFPEDHRYEELPFAVAITSQAPPRPR